AESIEKMCLEIQALPGPAVREFELKEQHVPPCHSSVQRADAPEARNSDVLNSIQHLRLLFALTCSRNANSGQLR
ncbi:MAG: hypothetical protein ABFD86_14150, partial [Bryobacteraceae bacterium]